MSQNHYITELINLQDKNIAITNVENLTIDGVNCIIVHALKERSTSDSNCKYCGSKNILPHAYHLRKIKFLDIAGFHSFIYYNQRRYLCKDCNKTFNENCSLVDKHSIISNATKKKILDECRKKQSYTDISDRLNISHTSVATTFNDHIGETRHKLTETICIDEFKASTIAGTYALIIGDPISGDIIDILPSRKQDYLYYYFHNIPDEERLSVKYVVTDLFESYRTIAKNLFWKSTHIADRFHWIRLTVEAFNKQRIRTMNFYKKIGDEQFKGKYNKYSTYYYIVKRYHKLLIANKFSKEAWYFDQKVFVHQFKKELTYQEIIEFILNFDSDLEEGYSLLQELYKLARLSTNDTAEKSLLDWIDKVNESKNVINELKQVTLTYNSWKKEIVNSFIINPISKVRITNAFIEGKNNFCKVIKRVGFGYKNFDTFRAKILYTNDLNKPYKN